MILVGGVVFSLWVDLIDVQPSCIRQMLECYQEFQKPMRSVQEVSLEEVRKYGIIEPVHPKGHPDFYLNSDQNLIPLKDLVEKSASKNASSRLEVVGRYLLT